MNSPLSQIGPYRGRCIATGGFADVYHVPDSPHGGPVALKWSHSNLDTSENESLAHEFNLLSELRHHRLPRAHAFGWMDERPYLVLDWIDGQPFWNPPLASDDEESFVLVLREIARVLTFVHGRGWVHGDLKPDNFLWGIPCTDGNRPAESPIKSPILYLMDFGLARRTGDRNRPRGAGTMGYTAPEFLQRQPADGRADWYSVGVILYEWFFGERPFASDEPALEVAGHLEHLPDLNRPMVRPGPEWVPDLLSRLLAKTPDERGSDVFDLLRWMSEYDPDLHPDNILSEQIDDHRRSEDRRLTPQDMSLIDQILRPQPGALLESWIISSGDADALRLARGLIGESANTRASITITATSGDDAGQEIRPGLPVVHKEADTEPVPPGCDARVSNTIRVVFRAPSRAHEMSPGRTDGQGVIGLTLRPKDLKGVEDYLAGVSGDAEFAACWSRPVWNATGGLPAALSNLFEFLIADGHMHRHDGHWELSESALTEWQARTDAATPFAEALGELTPDQRRVVDWFALGRSDMQIDVLRELLPMSDERISDAFHALRTRGVVIPIWPEPDKRFFDWRLRMRGLANIWRLQMPAQMRRRQALQLAATIESCSIHADTRVMEVLAECYSDAQSWDKCVHFAVSAVALHLKENRQDAAVPYVDLAGDAAQHIPEGKTRAYWTGRARMARGDYQEASGQIAEALSTFRQLLVFGRQTGDRRLLAEALKDLGSLYRLTRRFEKGVRVLRRARQLWEEIGDRVEVARTLNNLGNIYWVASDREEARRYYSEGLQIAQDLGEDQIVANILSNLGVTYKCDYDFERAELYYRKSLAIKERFDLPAEIALTLNNLGVIEFDQGRLQEAGRHYRRAIDLNDRVGAEAESVFTRGNLLQVVLERGDLRTAIAMGNSAICDADALGDVSTGAELRGFMAEAYQRAGDFHTSRACLEAARNQAEGQKNYDLEGHLGLVEALRCLRLGMGATANRILDGIEKAIAHAEMPRLRMDAAMIRANTAAAIGDHESADEWWRRGQAMAAEFAAPHKLAQLAYYRLPADPSSRFPHEARRQVNEFLSGSDERWHWAASYKLWAALHAVAKEDWPDAERQASTAIGQLREDGNWETLWRALEVYGRIHYKQSDYQPALAAFDEADRVLKEILKTIDDRDERQVYSSHPQARSLAEARQRIVELVA